MSEWRSHVRMEPRVFRPGEGSLALRYASAVMTWLLVGVGGAIGAMARHALNQLVHQRWLSSTFPIGIFLIPSVGAFLLGRA